MNYTSFYQQFASQGLFSTQEIDKAFPNFDARRLVEWQQKGYIQRVINRWYVFQQTPRDQNLLGWVANRIYQPAYLSLETALAFYNLIPEGVYAMTSVATRKTQAFHTPIGSFTYQHLKPSCFFGYQVLRSLNTGNSADHPVRMAYLEKALLDYCYLHPRLATVDDFAAMRLNATLLQSRLDYERLRSYLTLFNSKQLTQRINMLTQYVGLYA
jgi:predicted transcriptional regulator of viral defense system